MDVEQGQAAQENTPLEAAADAEATRRKPRGRPRTADIVTDADFVGPEHVTYVPGPDDPPQVKWRGRVFRANVPVEIKDAGHIESARGNRFFHVGPFDPERHGKPTLDVIRKPIDGKSYRAHVVGWLKKVETAEDLVQRWAGDQAIRDACEDIGTDDYMWLGHLIDPSLSNLLKQTEQADLAKYEAALWARYGVTVIPWRTENSAVATSG